MKQPLQAVRELIEHSFSAWGNRPAIVDRHGVLPYSALGELIDGVSRRLLTTGVRKGDRVAIDCDGRDLIVFMLAVMFSGACAAAVPGHYVRREREEFFKRCGITVFVSSCRDVPFPNLPGEVKENGPAEGFLLSRIPPEAPALKDVDIDTALLRSTSGTTGEGKGVLFSGESLVQRVLAANKGLSICAEDVIAWVLPMAYHFIVSIMLYLHAGACIVVPGKNDPAAFGQAIRRNRATVTYANEHFYKSMISHCSGEDLKSLRKAFSTSVGLSEKTAVSFHGKFGVPVSQAYGIIEVGLPFVNTDKPIEKAWSVGRILPDYRINIIDDHGHPVENGASGEICLAGRGMFDAYLDPFRRREDVCTDGWFHTGDIGSLDDEGYLRLTGRKGGVINCAGLKMFPEEIEGVLNQHPRVRRSLVQARPHPYLNEVPHALILPDEGSPAPGADELIAFCAAHLSPYKIPRSFEVVESLPMTGTGKLRR